MEYYYIFVSSEGQTSQPDTTISNIIQSRDIDNLQVIGISKGMNAWDAFDNLLGENTYLLETNFDELIAWKLADSYLNEQEHFYMKSM